MLYEKLEKLEDRKDLPLNGPDNYRVNNSIVYTRAIEINAVRQCNLSCRSCSHSSPIAPCNEYNPEDIERDLLKISQYLHSEFVRLLGGEPLLHSNLLEVLKVIKKTNISELYNHFFLFQILIYIFHKNFCYLFCWLFTIIIQPF